MYFREINIASVCSIHDEDAQQQIYQYLMDLKKKSGEHANKSPLNRIDTEIPVEYLKNESYIKK